MILHNRINKEELKERLHKETFKRITISFYRYFWIDEIQEFRDKLFAKWFSLNCFGRIYVAREGINAQMSVPEYNLDVFLEQLNGMPGLENMHIKYAVEDDGKSFYKLTIKVREKIVADGLNDGAYDVTNVGNHLSAIEFHNYIDNPDTLVVDMRNHYEYEIGRFKNAYSPNADTFQEAITNAVTDLADKKDKRILLYCTGGIRCEKASAYFKHNGFENVNQLNGGIIEYAQQIKKLDLEPKFTGKNFVFDERLGESIDGKVISKCHQCGKPCDNHTNCAHDDCHQLFIQCDDCKVKYDGCCSEECQYVFHLPQEEKLQFRVIRHNHYSRSKIYSKIQKEKLEAHKEKSISE